MALDSKKMKGIKKIFPSRYIIRNGYLITGLGAINLSHASQKLDLLQRIKEAGGKISDGKRIVGWWYVCL